MRTAMAIALCGLCCSARAQPEVKADTIRAVQPWAPHAEYTFPQLEIPDRSVQTARIQRDLALRLLDIDLDTVAQGHLFDGVWGDPLGEWMPRLNSITWDVRTPMPEVVEVEFSAEGCGAYCEGFTSYLQYDLRDGAYIGYDSLFTPSGRVILADTLRAMWVKQVSAFLAQLNIEHAALKSQVRSDTLAVAEELQMFQAQVELYQRCLEERAGYGPYVMDLSIEPANLRFHMDRCANHVEQALDELDPLSIILPMEMVVPLMRPERQALFR
ncbi:MAG: hypothetical protein JNL52_02780 [Flavobacteriales bacterium]|nr:hypothetical protein [Flavobacteriales bacterium]